MDAIEKMLKSFKIRRLVLSAIPSLVETWTSGFGFQPIDDCERTQLSQVNLMLFPGTVMLIKYLDACSDTASEITTLHDVKANQFHHIDGFDEVNETETGPLTCDTGKTIKPHAELPLPVTLTFPEMHDIDEQQRGFSVSPSEAPNLVCRHDDHGITSDSESLCTTQIYVTELVQHDNISYPLVTREPTSLNTSSSSLTVSAPDSSGFNISNDTIEDSIEDKNILCGSEDTFGTEKHGRKLSEDGLVGSLEGRREFLSNGQILEGCLTPLSDGTKLEKLDSRKVSMDDSEVPEDETCYVVRHTGVPKVYTPGEVEK